MVDEKPARGMRTPIHSVRQPAMAFDIYKAEEGVLDLFADGYFGIWGDGAVTRIGLYVSEEPKIDNDQVIEQRVLRARLIVPTRNLVQMCIKVVQRAAQAPERFGVEDLLRDAGIEFVETEGEGSEQDDR